jgi:hypothetical protein
VSDYLKVPAGEPIPLSVLALDLVAPVEGWNLHLAGRNIEIVEDDLGRASIGRADAQRLIAEEREREALRREKAAEAERLAVEADEQWRAQIWRGLPADHLPVGAAPAAVMQAADRDARPRRTSVLQEAGADFRMPQCLQIGGTGRQWVPRRSRRLGT